MKKNKTTHEREVENAKAKREADRARRYRSRRKAAYELNAKELEDLDRQTQDLRQKVEGQERDLYELKKVALELVSKEPSVNQNRDKYSIDDILKAVEETEIPLDLRIKGLNKNTANTLDIEQIVKDSKEQVEKATVNKREAKRPLDLEGMIKGLTEEASNEKPVAKKIEEPKERKEIWRPF